MLLRIDYGAPEPHYVPAAIPMLRDVVINYLLELPDIGAEITQKGEG